MDYGRNSCAMGAIMAASNRLGTGLKRFAIWFFSSAGVPLAKSAELSFFSGKQLLFMDFNGAG
jgi:hypothetical protein